VAGHKLTGNRARGSAKIRRGKGDRPLMSWVRTRTRLEPAAEIEKFSKGKLEKKLRVPIEGTGRDP